ncbi:hypothetical protein [Nostoc sp. UIC 10630]|uniref:hypothetical protein n=1 Tax=Nostoc sp. UIC 10630 TaxID=2100146 RepID=UPI0013D1AD49|nr:hypothetical protein [Nostoc sp. UIC 10630]NEU82097.1 hypothetical protein [Nostoc sp. UIC 10630]
MKRKTKKSKDKTRPQITDEIIHSHLTQLGLIENFYVCSIPKLNSAAIFYLSHDKKLLMYLVQDPQLNATYIKYLEKMGIPIFSDILKASEYGKSLLDKVEKEKTNE